MGAGVELAPVSIGYLISMKSAFMTIVRYGWFGLLVLLAFGYLAAGFSDRKGLRKETSRTPAEQTASAKQTVGSSANANHTPPVALPGSATTLGPLTAIEASLAQGWEEAGVERTEIADWLTVCRRMSLALVGNGLALQEIRRLESLPEGKREQSHLESLLRDPRFHQYWAERWARFYVGADEGPFLVYRRRRFRMWLTDQLAANTRYDVLVRKLVAAEGLWTDQPQVNFLTVTFDSNDGQPDPVRLAARASRAFLGLRIDCLQCHDDFLGNVSLGSADSPRAGLQSDFHQLAAFFSSAKTNGLQGVQERKADYRYQYLGADAEVEVTPSVPYQPELLPPKGSSRNRLAVWMTHPENRQAARSAVSHIWALLFGRSATDAIDNLPLDEPAPAVIEALTDEFIASGFNVRDLIRMIVYSSAFRVSSRAEFEITAAHEDSGAVFPLTRLRPEQVAACIIQSGRIKKIDRDSSLLLQLDKFGSTNDFVRRYGDVGEDEFSSDSVTISQRLIMLNGSMLRKSIGDNPVLNSTNHINRFAKSDVQAVQTTYLTVLNRYPSATEEAHFVKRLSESENRRSGVEDLFWVLLNSTELAWNH
ncbi:hypothetical protein Pla52o_31890 [Novipirellula galeiformis]|uniref:DUF1553 domain-containing protein n=2 Tax=Novipirellula galeiformis TaxID=2528004 RepID=A0A5C6CFD6_9BACT|nr:hypothetical protein Pla52o_31890 [Novipirellula galeiformis]